MEREKEKKINDYEVIEQIGKGTLKLTLRLLWCCAKNQKKIRWENPCLEDFELWKHGREGKAAACSRSKYFERDEASEHCKVC